MTAPFSKNTASKNSAKGDSPQAVAGSSQVGGDSIHPGVEDPVYRHTLYEAKVILGMWAICLLGTCTFCYLYGYTSHPAEATPWGLTIGQWAGPLESFDRAPDSLKTPWGLGIPAWVLFGIVIPWLFCILATWWFCLFVFHDDNLEDNAQKSNQEDRTGSPVTAAAGDSA